MATIIDHMILELDLDPKKFDEGTKKQAEAWLKLRQQSQQTKDQISEHTDKLAEGFSRVTSKITAFIAVFFTAEKIAQFTANIVRANVAIGNLSAITGVSVETLSKWEGAAARAGSSAEAMRKTISGLDHELKASSIGDSSGAIAQVVLELDRMGEHVSRFEANGDARKATDVLMDIVKAMDKLNMAPQRRTAFLQAMGIDDSVIVLLNKGHVNLQKMLEEQKDFLVVTKDNEEAARKLWQLWEELSQSAENIGRRITLGLLGPFGDIVDNHAANKKLGEQGGAGIWSGQNSGGYGGALPGLDEGDGDQLPKNAKPRSFSGSASNPSNDFAVGQGASGSTMQALGINDKQWNAFRQGMANIESSGGNYGLMGGAGNKYAGAYQLNREEIEKAVKTLGEALPSTQAFLKDRQMQERYFDVVTKQNHDFLMKNSQQYKNLGSLDQLKMLGYAHNQGPTGARKFMESGKVGRDAFGTPGTRYIQEIDKQLKQTGPGADSVFDKGSTPLPLLANPRLLRAPRFNQPIEQGGGNFSSSETTVHSLIVNGVNKPLTDDAYGLGGEAITSLDRGRYMNQMTEGPN